MISHLKAGEIMLALDERGNLIPADAESVERVFKMKRNQEYLFTMKRARNTGFHRKYFSMLNLAFQNQDKFESSEWFREHTLIAIGHCETLIDPFTGNVFMKAKSIDFTKCSQPEFEEIYKRTLDHLVSKYGYTKEFIEELIGYA